MLRQPVSTSKGAPPKGIYSQAIIAEGKQVYVSGQGPVDPVSGELQLGSFAGQAKLTFQNVTTLLEESGSAWEHVVKVNVYLADLNNFAEMNEIYKTFAAEPYPARTTVEAGLGKIAIEVDCVALIPA
jgi:2-iminobutanoate/2-iminopropanoate deaminase